MTLIPIHGDIQFHIKVHNMRMAMILMGNDMHGAFELE